MRAATVSSATSDFDRRSANSLVIDSIVVLASSLLVWNVTLSISPSARISTRWSIRLCCLRIWPSRYSISLAMTIRSFELRASAMIRSTNSGPVASEAKAFQTSVSVLDASSQGAPRTPRSAL
jgi:hypothetical protein